MSNERKSTSKETLTCERTISLHLWSLLCAMTPSFSCKLIHVIFENFVVKLRRETTRSCFTSDIFADCRRIFFFCSDLYWKLFHVTHRFLWKLFHYVFSEKKIWRFYEIRSRYIGCLNTTNWLTSGIPDQRVRRRFFPSCARCYVRRWSCVVANCFWCFSVVQLVLRKLEATRLCFKMSHIIFSFIVSLCWKVIFFKTLDNRHVISKSFLRVV